MKAFFNEIIFFLYPTRQLNKIYPLSPGGRGLGREVMDDPRRE